MNKIAPEQKGPAVTLENYCVSIKDYNNKVPENDAGRVFSSGSVSLDKEDKAEVVEEIEELMLGQVFTEPGREKWSNEKDFILALIGFAIDLSNIWRFPYLVLKYGGGTFLVPYFVLWVFFGVPVLYLELIIGQYTRQGPVASWKLVPLFKGIGFCTLFVSYIVSFYYNVVMAWSLIYIKDSFSIELPWSKCDNDWSTGTYCVPLTPDAEPEALPSGDYKTSATDYWNAKVLRLHTTFWSEGDESNYTSKVDNDIIRRYFNFEDSGGVNLDTAMFLLCVSLFLLCVLTKGIRVTGKIVWFTATIPYIIMALLLFRGLSLPGSLDGISFYIKPDVEKLLHIDTWTAAATQIFFSSGAGFGVHLTFASFNPFNQNILRDCLFVAVVTGLTSVFAGFVIFTYMGNLAYMLDRNLTSVTTQGPDLVFKMFPDVVQGLGGANFYTFCFFTMLLTLGVDNAIGGMETVIAGLSDEFKAFFLKRKHTKGLLCFLLISVSYLLSLTNATRAGIYYFFLWDNYAVGPPLIITVMIQTIALSWFFGLKELCDITEIMTGYRPNLFFRITWKFITPLLLLGTFISTTIFQQEIPTYDDKVSFDDAKYVGLGLTMIPVLIIVPLCAILQLLKTKGPFRLRFLLAISPLNEHKEIMETGQGKRYTKAHWCYIGGLCDTYSALKELEEKMLQEELENAMN